MPCYDPPPPHEGEYKNSAHEACRILCDIITAKLNECEPKFNQSKILNWYINHRRIDIEEINYYCNYKPKSADQQKIEKALQDIEKAKQEVNNEQGN